MSTPPNTPPISSTEQVTADASDAAIRLIVNADDLGRGAAMDRGIFCAWADGIVTSVSILANGSTFRDAAGEARRLGMPVGVHLNIAEGHSLSGDIRGLTQYGEFPGKCESRRRLHAGKVNIDDLHREIAAQIERLFDAGLRPDHFDSHQHTLLFPAAAETILAVAGQFGITAARLPLPQEPVTADPPGPLGDELALYRSLAPDLCHRLHAAGFRTPDGLWGMPALNRLDEEALRGMLRRLPPGTWELMVHPGGCDPADSFATPERVKEVAALTAPSIQSLVRQRQIQLIHFGDIPCAS